VIQHAIHPFDPPAKTAIFEHEYRDRHDAWHPVCFSGTLDKRVGTRCFVLFKDGTTSCVRIERVRESKTKTPIADVATNPQPKCVLSTCDLPVAQGLCPVFHGRRSSCSLAHFREARDKEDFIHPGLLTPGMVHPFVVPGSVPPPPPAAKANGKRPRDPVAVPSVGHDEAEAEAGDIDDLIEAFNEVMRTARPGERPAAWLRAAQSAAGADYLSLFDGDKGNINRAASTFGLDGLPPVDLNALYPVNL